MTASEVSCPYCGHAIGEVEGTRCHFCEMVLEDEYVIHIDGEGQAINLCSIECMDLLEDVMEMEE
jgi:hypothetical protein